MSTGTIDVKVEVKGLSKLARSFEGLGLQVQITALSARSGYRAERRREELRLQLAKLRQLDDPYLHVDLVTVCTPTGTVCRVRSRRLGGWSERKPTNVESSMGERIAARANRIVRQTVAPVRTGRLR